MSKDKYTRIFSCQMGATVCIILQIFLQRAGQNVYEQLIVKNVLLRGMLTFQCSLVRFYERTNVSLLLQQQLNALPS